MATMTTQLAEALTRAGMDKANRDFNRPICISVCDNCGNLMAFCRMDGAPLRSISIAQQKAYTASRMGISSEAFLVRLRTEDLDMASFCDPLLTALPGGSPIKDKEGRLLGGVGVSGLLAREDQSITEYLAEMALA